MNSILVFAAVVGLAASSVIPQDAEQLKGQKLVDKINSAQNLWKAADYDFAKLRINKKLMKLDYIQPNKEEDIVEIAELDEIPESFDARQQWPNCVSINNIRDQSDCGGCWAFAAAEAMSDRTCIASKGAVNTILSAEDLLSCCVGIFSCGEGCNGGYPIHAWRWWVKNGLVTGGSFESQFGCKPYSISPCGETIGNKTWPDCPKKVEKTPKCVQECTSKTYTTDYLSDKHFGKSAYAVSKKASQIQAEILANGPVEAGFTVYEDFYQYKTGVYVHTHGAALGGHAVKILGWGVDNGTPYWLVANSWNIAWGENGYFRILRGVNECGIEHGIVAGLPDVSR